MTMDSGATSAAGTTTGGDTSTRDVAKEQAMGVGQTAAQAGGHVAQTATEQAAQVAEEARRQARDLVGEARYQVTSQASQQQQRAAAGLRSLGSELNSLVTGQGGQGGLAEEIATQASQRVRDLADWLEQREPADLVEELRLFARRRPGAFLLGAAVAGVLAGRLTRGVVAVQQGRQGQQGYQGYQGYAGQEALPAAAPGPVGAAGLGAGGYAGDLTTGGYAGGTTTGGTYPTGTTTGGTYATGTTTGGYPDDLATGTSVHGRHAVGERPPTAGPLGADPEAGGTAGGVPGRGPVQP